MRTRPNHAREGIRHLIEQMATACSSAWSAAVLCQSGGGQLVIGLARIAVDQENALVGEVSQFDLDAERSRELEVPVPLNRIRRAVGIEVRALQLIADIDTLDARRGCQTSCLVTLRS